MAGGAVAVRAGAESGRPPAAADRGLAPPLGLGFLEEPPFARAFMVPGSPPAN